MAQLQGLLDAQVSGTTDLGIALGVVGGGLTQPTILFAGSLVSYFAPDAPPYEPTANVPFEIGSNSKVFTALLYQQSLALNVVSSTDSLSDYFSTELSQRPDLQGITLGSLATYSSGLPLDDHANPGNPDAPSPLPAPYTTQDMFAWLNNSMNTNSALYPHLSQPPEYAYSNLGWSLLAESLLTAWQAHDGAPDLTLQQLYQREVFTPLHLWNTHFYTSSDIGTLPQGETDSSIVNATWPAYDGAGGIVSSPADMLAWLQFNMQHYTSDPDDGLFYPLYNASTVQTNPGQTPAQFTGVGWFVTPADPDFGGRALIVKDGGVPSFHSYEGFTANPATGLAENGFFILTNSPTPEIAHDAGLAALRILQFGQGDLSGPWNRVVGQQTTRVRINQSQGTLNTFNASAPTVNSQATFGDPGQVLGKTGDLQSLTGTIDTTTADHGRIIWSDGQTWLRLSLGGQYYNPANQGLTSVTQSFDPNENVQLTFSNVAGGTTIGTINSSNVIELPGWGQTASFVDGQLIFSGGSVWNKLDLPPSYATSMEAGKTVWVQQFGLPVLVFVNRLGQTSNGRWLNPTTVIATDWNSTGIVADGQIVWNGGQSVWSRQLIVSGASSGVGTVSITAIGQQVLLTNRQGGTSSATIVAPNTFKTGANWGNIIGTRQGGKILWANGTVWDEFDYNALNAVFTNITQFPF
ncbi:MAG: serine hydrolase domain-containing protein [Planctomycetales bacterium]